MKRTYRHRAAYAPTPTSREVVADSYNVKVDAKKPGDPIRVAPKGKKGRKRDNVFFDDRGFPDVSDEFDYLLHRTGGGKVIRKRLHPSPRIDEVDEQFNVQYEDARHGDKLRRELIIDHLTSTQQEQLVALIKKYWAIFDDTGLFIPVKDYECVIDTGSARPICVKNINYGPRETPIMNKCIAALEKLGHISQTHHGQWLFKALLAPKPHQEHITDIDDFVWRFCVNFIPLNQVTRVIAYPIPRCDSAVMLAFGKAKWFWLKDAPSGYNQLRVEESSREKLAFAGPGAIKWHYNVMPFGPVNGPVIFIAFIHDMDATWKELATSRGITIDEDTNTKIIVDDIWSHSVSFEKALAYLECQFAVCKAQRLSLSLTKCHFFPPRIEFVGIDVTVDGNHPAMSKHDLLNSWPLPKIVRDVSSFLGFAVFYSSFIPLFELRVLRLRQITREESTAPVATLFDKEAADEWEDIKHAILSDPCLRRFDYKKRLYLRTDFCALGFGYAACQPGSDQPSLDAMMREMAGGECEFLKEENKHLTLHPVALGARTARGREGKLHSYLGEAFAGDWARNKCRHMCFGQRYTWITDCYGIRFILTYDGPNPAVQRVQMRIMCDDCDVVHRNRCWNVDADYFSYLGKDLCFDPLLLTYARHFQTLRRSHPVADSLPMRPENMPGYRGPRIKQQDAAYPPAEAVNTLVDYATTTLLSTILFDDSNGHDCLENIPVKFGYWSQDSQPSSSSGAVSLYNSDLPVAAYQIARSTWAIHGYNCGHFMSSIQSRSLPFDIVLASDPTPQGRAQLQEFTTCRLIFNGVAAMFSHVRSSGDTTKLDGYLIHPQSFATPQLTRDFWQLQLSLIVQLRKLRSLAIVVAFLPPTHDSRAANQFASGMKRDGWLGSSIDLYFPHYGDSVASNSTVLSFIHSNTEENATILRFATPPASPPPTLASYVWPQFNTGQYAVSYGRDDKLFNKGPVSGATTDTDDALTLRVSEPKPGDSTEVARSAKTKYLLHSMSADASVAVGAQVLSLDGLCPPFRPQPNLNLFQNSFGIEFVHDGHVFVRPFSPFELARCFCLSDDITHALSQPDNVFLLQDGIPAHTSAWIFDQIYERLIQIRNANIELFDPSRHAAPAACCQAFVNGAVGTRLPGRDQWITAYADDPQTSKIREMVSNPALVVKEHLALLEPTYRSALRQGRIVLEQDMLILQEQLDTGSSYIKLRLVPTGLREILFIAFHANPIGGHFNPYRTYARLRLRYYWPGMYKYCQLMCKKCPGCALANGVIRASSELIYSFPVAAPFRVLHVDGYQAGDLSSFEGRKVHVIALDGMTSYACNQSVQKANSTSFAKALMKIILTHGIPHTLVLDKDSKFYGTFRETCDLLQMNVHTLSGDNHKGMLVERFNRYLNRGLRVLTNERESVRVSDEALDLLAYAWNSAPVAGTDLSRSLVAMGREFSFPIDFSVSKHLELTSTPSAVQSYAKNQATLMAACYDVAKVLLDEHRKWHQELANSSRPDPRQWQVGDIVFARRQTRSHKGRGIVGKLQFAHTGPWRIVTKLDGASYELQHCINTERRLKRHASHLSPFPLPLVPFEPVDGPDNQYGQINRPIGLKPYLHAGLEGFEPLQPFKMPPSVDLATASHSCRTFHWPSLSELNDEMSPFPWETGEREQVATMTDDDIVHASLYHGPPPTMPVVHPPRLPTPSALAAMIVKSDDRLFFISHELPNSGRREWRLIRVHLADSMALRPTCLTDGRYLVEFYMVHPSDLRYNAANQRYWLQYHLKGDLIDPSATSETHLIRPSDSSEQLALRHNLSPLRQWVTLTHEAVYIHGPFDFASVSGRKSRDRVDAARWTVLAQQQDMYSNLPPSLELPTYSIHADRGIHLALQEGRAAELLLSVSQCCSDAHERLFP